MIILKKHFTNNGGKEMEYTIDVDEENKVTNYHPVLSDEEREEIEQEFLRVIAKLFEKYGIK